FRRTRPPRDVRRGNAHGRRRPELATEPIVPRDRSIRRWPLGPLTIDGLDILPAPWRSRGPHQAQVNEVVSISRHGRSASEAKRREARAQHEGAAHAEEEGVHHAEEG